MADIGEGTFKDCTSLVYINIPYRLTEIGKDSFMNCISLTFIEIPSPVRKIGDNAFAHCNSLTDVTIPDGVEFIGENAFASCTSLASITIPNSVKKLGVKAFENCPIKELTTDNENFALPEYYGSNIETIIVGNNVNSINHLSLWGCSSLKTLMVEDGNQSFVSIDGVLYSKDRNKIIAYPVAKSNYFEIPAHVESLEEGAFASSIINHMIIPNNVKHIAKATFAYCPFLKSIEIPDSITCIERSLFIGCSSLTSIKIPNSVTKIESNAFSYCSSLISINIPNSITCIGESAFYECHSLSSIVIPNGVQKIEEYTFYKCTSLISIVIPNSVEYICNSAFYYCSNLKELHLKHKHPENLWYISFSTFSDLSDCTLFVPIGTGYAYRHDNRFKVFKEVVIER